MIKNIISYAALFILVIGGADSADLISSDGTSFPVDINFKVYSNDHLITNNLSNIIYFEIRNNNTRVKSIANDLLIKGRLSKYITLDKREKATKYFYLPRRYPAKMGIYPDGNFYISCSSLSPQESIMFNYTIRPVLEKIIGASISDNCTYVMSNYWSVFGELKEDISTINIIKNESMDKKDNVANPNNPPFDMMLLLLILMLAVALCVYIFIKWKR
jgi:hypothetical protein